MQRIYFDGKETLGINLPEDWITPEKRYNFRSSTRIITLANNIRNDADQREQIAVKTHCGFARCFVIDTNKDINKNNQEAIIRKKMAEITKDILWNDAKEVKTLILEHHMVANRGGFSNFFNPLYSVEKYRQGLLDGSLSEINFLIKVLYELILAYKNENKVKITQIVKKYSDLLSKKNLHANKNLKDNLVRIQNALSELFSITDNEESTLKGMITNIKKNSLFELPETFATILENSTGEIYEQNDELNAFQEALNCSFSELEAYANYILGNSPFDTHQGVKGLEFERVMAIIDDEESRGFMFKYDKLFGISPLSKTDIDNENTGKETGIDRARRLFYVICTRAKESLAVVAYTKQPSLLKEQLLSKHWFTEDEIITM